MAPTGPHRPEREGIPLIDSGPESSDAPPETTAKLPVRQLVSAGYRSLFRDWRAFVASASPWWVVLALLTFGIEAFAEPGLRRIVGAIVTFVLWAVAGTVFLVGWHRHILLGEAVASRASLRFGRRKLRFLVTGILFYLVLVAPMVAIGLFVGILGPAVAGTGLDRVLALGPVVALAIMIVVAPRLSLASPMVALDAPGRPLATAWQLVRGQTWRLFDGALLVIVPFGLVEHTLDKGIEALARAPHMAALGHGLTLASVVVLFANIAVAAGFISHAYARLTGHPLPPDPRQS